MKVRTFQKKDTDFITPLRVQYYDSLNEEYDPQQLEEEIKSFKSNSDNEIFIVQKEQQNLGFIWIETQKQGILIKAIHVIKEYQKEGVGSQLMDAAINWAKNKNQSDLWLTVKEENQSARHLYDKKGFKFYRHLMRKQL